MPRTLLEHNPLLYLLIPLCLGIWSADRYDLNTAAIIAVVVVAVIALIFMTMMRVSPLKSTRWQWWRAVPVVMLAWSVGYSLMTLQLPDEIDVSRSKGTPVTARIESLEVRETTMDLDVLVTGSIDTPLVGQQVRLNVIGCDYAFEPGDIISFSAALEHISNRGNPFEFNYKDYCRRRGIALTQRIEAMRITRAGSATTFFNAIECYRLKATHHVMAMDNLTMGSRRLIIAITLGDSEFINRDTRYLYSAAGIAHLLALSGLHIAIISLILSLLLYPLDYAGHRNVRFAVTFVVTVGYMIFTGLSPSVVRAGILVIVVMLTRMLSRKATLGNALCIAALVTLLIHPADLFNAGFILSYFTVITISVASSTLLPRLSTRFKVVNYIIGLIVVSIVSSIATSVITAYYFNTVAPLSFISNTILLPAFPLIMVVAIVELILACIGIDPIVTASIMNGCNTLIDLVASSVSSWSAMAVGPMWIDSVGVALACGGIALLLLSATGRKTRWAIAGLVLLIASTFTSWRYHDRFGSRAIYYLNTSTGTAVLSVNGDSAVVWAPYARYFDLAAFRNNMRGLLGYHGITHLSELKADNDEHSRVNLQMAHLSGHITIAAGGGQWKRTAKAPIDSTTPLPHARFMLITRRYHHTVSALRRYAAFDTVMLAGNLDATTRALLLAECDSLHLPALSLHTGATRR